MRKAPIEILDSLVSSRANSNYDRVHYVVFKNTPSTESHRSRRDSPKKTNNKKFGDTRCFSAAFGGRRIFLLVMFKITQCSHYDLMSRVSGQRANLRHAMIHRLIANTQYSRS